jgi:hypothetical protein
VRPSWPPHTTILTIHPDKAEVDRRDDRYLCSRHIGRTSVSGGAAPGLMEYAYSAERPRRWRRHYQACWTSTTTIICSWRRSIARAGHRQPLAGEST